MYGIYANIWGILMVNVTIYSIHGSYGILGCSISGNIWDVPNQTFIEFPDFTHLDHLEGLGDAISAFPRPSVV